MGRSVERMVKVGEEKLYELKEDTKVGEIGKTWSSGMESEMRNRDTNADSISSEGVRCMWKKVWRTHKSL